MREITPFLRSYHIYYGLTLSYIHCKKNKVVLTELGYLRKHIKMSICTFFQGTLLTSMGMLGDQQDDSQRQAFKWPLTCEAFGNKQTHCKLLKGQLNIILVTSCKLSKEGHWMNPIKENHDLNPDRSRAAWDSILECMLSNYNWVQAGLG